MRLEDIAKLADVSVSSVSLALNDRPGISKKTREKILKIIEESNYVPPKNSKLNVKTVRILIVKHSNSTNNYQIKPFFSELLEYLDLEAKKNKIYLILNLINQNSLMNEFKFLESNQPSDALIILSDSVSLELIAELKKNQPNTLVINNSYLSTNIDFLNTNNVYSGYTIANYLFQLGHLNIGYISSSERKENFIEREIGVKKAFKEKKIILNEEFIYSFMPAEIADYSKEMKEKIMDENFPTAFICENDYLAISLIKSLHSLDKKVPEQVSVVGFDNIPEGKIFIPELTTIAASIEFTAEIAIKKILNFFKKEYLPTQTLIPSQIIIRDSCQKK